MINPPAIVQHNDDVSHVMSLFDSYNVWQLPVVKDDEFIGFVSKSALFIRYREILLEQQREADIFARL
jgi:CIC family chloride channel protein